MENIPPPLIINWDQTGIRIGTFTAVFCGSLTGDFLPIQVIYKGKTTRCHPRYKFPSGWHITHSPKHWSNEETMIQYIESIIVLYVERQRELLEEDKPALVVIDNFKGQVTSAVNTLLDENNIHVCLLPPNTSDLLQPMDLSVNKPAKEFLRGKFQEWYSNKITKQLDKEEDIEKATDMCLPVMNKKIHLIRNI